jgi:hypothetical protein
MSDEYDADKPPSGDWDTDEALAQLKMEKMVNPTESLTDEGLALKLLNEAAPLAAKSIVQVALHSPNDNTRLNASKYIIDVVREGSVGGKSKLEELLGDVVDQAELYANDSANGER